MECLDDWSNKMDLANPVDVVYIDLQKAFDIVSFQKFLFKFEQVSIRGPLLMWLENFLSGREHSVSVNGSRSCWGDVKSGIPQGKVL